MARGNSTATGAATTADTLANTYSGNAGALYGPLSGELQSEAAHPAGIDPTTMARMDTAALQTGGGSTGAAVGQGALRAARTRNAGGSDAAIASAARSGGETASRGILGNRIKSAEMQDRERQSALSGLNNLFAENLSGGNQALGQVAGDVNASTNAENASWDWAKDLFDPIMQATLGAGGNIAGKAMGCWIAEAIYGVDDPRTHLVRAWLNGPFRQTATGDFVMRIYLAIGRQVAWVARRSSLLRFALRPLFDRALAHAMEAY